MATTYMYMYNVLVKFDSRGFFNVFGRKASVFNTEQNVF